MTLAMERSPSSKVPAKQLCKEGTFRNPNTPKFKCRQITSVRDFPSHCGLSPAKEEQKSIGVLHAVNPLSIVSPDYMNSNVDEGIEGKVGEFISAIAPMNLNQDHLLGDFSSRSAHDNMLSSKKSLYEAVKISKTGDEICLRYSMFGSDYETKLMEKPRETKFQFGDDSGDDDDCVIIDVKSSNTKLVNKNEYVHSPTTSRNSNQSDQVKIPKRWELECADDDDEISILSPSEWQNLIDGHSENRADLSNKCTEKDFSKEKKQDTKSKELENLDFASYDVATEIGSHNQVKEVLNHYHELCYKLANGKELNGGPRTKQVHVKAAMMLKKEAKWLNSNQTCGHVPGVEIGDQFQFRAELVVVGLHHEFVCGISCATMAEAIYAISIVDSGRYENKVKSSNVLVYSGKGGNPRDQTKQLKDQTLEGGNLALKNSMDAKVPVRVIRKIQVEGKKHMYIYDGLYNVVKFWPERAETGKFVYMFEMVRMSGQPDCNLLRISELRESIKHLEDRKIVISKDVSEGKEKLPIMVINEISDEKLGPFTYITEMKCTCFHESSVLSGCDCINGCSDSHQCLCVKRNRGEIPFNEEGAILRYRKMIYECGPNCKCPLSCSNRVSQHGPKLPLEVFKTKSTGWGVRSREEIRSGSFICEYLGELIEDEEADRRTNDEYLFDLDDGNGFTIDAAKYGNVSRFINHSCSPNLYAQNVLYDHADRKVPHVILFAMEDIRALEELTYHYNYNVDRVHDSNGNIKKKKCCCGSRKCKGRLY